MTRLINADKVLKKAETMYVAIDSSLNSVLAVNAYDIKHAPTVDAVPVEFIEAEIKRMEYEIEHALIKYKHADGTIERMIARKAALEFILAKWKHMCSNCQEFDCYGCRYKREEE